MRIALASLLLSSTLLAADTHSAPAPAASAPTPQQAYDLLLQGNKRYTTSEATHPNATEDRRCATTSGGQHPYATILSCADSRVPPEMIFDAGIGDLFVIRVAGNVSDVDEIATIEYGVCHLNTPVIVVMGHSKCGAVTAVVDKAALHGNLAQLLDNIQPAAEDAKKQNPDLSGAPLVAKAVRANVYQSMADLISHSPDVAAKLKEKKVTLVGAVYDIHSGQVDFIGGHPNETALLEAGATPAHTDAHSPAKEMIKGKDDHKDAAHAPSWRDRVHGKKQGAADTHATPEAHSNADAAITPTLVQKYGPLSAFVVGSLALSAVVMHLVRK